MPKLPTERAEGAAKQESGDYMPVPKGRYVFKLDSVEEGETGPNSANPGSPKWVWKLVIDKDYHPELRKGRWQMTQFEHVPLTESMDWKLKALFEGFGYTTDSDTDEIVEDDDARIVGYLSIGDDNRDKKLKPADRRKTNLVQRWTTFDPTKWEKTPYEDDEDDNQ